MAGGKKAPTQSDIAARAGVSQRAVAVVVGKSGPDSRVGVSEQTRRRILKIAREIGYRPHRQAQLLRGVKSDVIGVIKTLSSRPSASLASRRLVERIRGNGYGVAAYEMLWGTEELSRAVGNLLDMNVEGIFFQGGIRPLDAASRRALGSAGIPVVSVTGSRQKGFPFFGSDLRTATAEAFRHLRAGGRRRIGLILDRKPEPQAEQSSWEYDECIEGFRAAASEEKLGESAAPVFDLDRRLLGVDDFSPAREFASGWSGSRMPEAFVCFRDAIAIGLIAGLREAGLAVPKDVAVVGLDDSPVGRHVSPELTSMEEPIEEIVDRAADCLFSRIGSEGPPARGTAKLFPCRLKVRESCGTKRSKTGIRGTFDSPEGQPGKQEGPSGSKDL